MRAKLIDPFSPFTTLEEAHNGATFTNPVAQTWRETQLEQLLRDALPDLEWIEGTSKTDAARRELIERIKAEING